LKPSDRKVVAGLRIDSPSCPEGILDFDDSINIDGDGRRAIGDEPRHEHVQIDRRRRPTIGWSVRSRSHRVPGEDLDIAVDVGVRIVGRAPRLRGCRDSDGSLVGADADPGTQTNSVVLVDPRFVLRDRNARGDCKALRVRGEGVGLTCVAVTERDIESRLTALALVELLGCRDRERHGDVLRSVVSTCMIAGHRDVDRLGHGIRRISASRRRGGAFHGVVVVEGIGGQLLRRPLSVATFTPAEANLPLRQRRSRVGDEIAAVVASADGILDDRGNRFFGEQRKKDQQAIVPNDRREIRAVAFELRTGILEIIARNVDLHLLPRIPVLRFGIEVSVIEEVRRAACPAEDVELLAGEVDVQADYQQVRDPRRP